MKGARRAQGADMNSQQDFDRQQRVGYILIGAEGVEMFFKSSKN